MSNINRFTGTTLVFIWVFKQCYSYIYGQEVSMTRGSYVSARATDHELAHFLIIFDYHNHNPAHQSISIIIKYATLRYSISYQFVAIYKTASMGKLEVLPCYWSLYSCTSLSLSLAAS